MARFRVPRGEEVTVAPSTVAIVWSDGPDWFFVLRRDLGLARGTSKEFGPYDSKREAIRRAGQIARQAQRSVKARGSTIVMSIGGRQIQGRKEEAANGVITYTFPKGRLRQGAVKQAVERQHPGHPVEVRKVLKTWKAVVWPYLL